MGFLKPTRGKILFTIVLFALWVLILYLYTSYFACSLGNLEYPPIPGHLRILPSPMQNTFSSITGAIGFPLSLCSVLDLSEVYRNFAINLSYVLHFIFAYLIACLIVFLSDQLIKNPKRKIKK
jgi:hypothetical protein